ncbi:MAG: hypothetical protein R3301_12885, partial [Saprospiraceae bacterium]|nr:hypothetical protein [Saprospiraceae bacterium]
MNWQRSAIAIVSLICIVFGSTGTLQAEGTKQLSPADTNEVMLHTNANGFGNFAEFGANDTSSLFVRITDTVGPTRDTLYIGLSREAMDNGDLENIGNYQFRIVDPAGNVVHGPFNINSSNNNADTWLLASSGPDVLDAVNGYSTNTAMHPFAVFVPDTIGDFRLEFSDGSSGNIVNVKWFDFTVVNSGAEMPGRLWSRNWALRTPPSNGNMPPECQFNQAFNGTLYSYTMDGFVSRIDFDSSGFQGLSFTVAFGLTGPGNTGDIIADRMSVNNMNATAGAADHMVFVQEPDIVEFPSPANPCGTAEILGIECIGDSVCIRVGVTRMGQVEILLDFANDNQLFDPDTTDVLLAMAFSEADTACLFWDGLMGDGTPVDFGMMIPTYLRYAQGVQHYAAFDVELLKNGWCVETVRPICPGVSTELLYWDDSNITDDLVTTTIDEGDPGTGQPKVQLNGCVCGVGGCRTWTNFQIGDPPSGTCTGTPIGYGEQSTLNTWWFASTTFEGPIMLPFIGVDITGDSTVCVGDSTVFTAEGTPDTIDYEYIWEGPNGFMATTMTTGFVSDPGVYRVTITDTVANCTAIDSITLVQLALPTTMITTSCPMSNTPNGDIDLTVSGSGPFTYMWSNGAMTEDLTNVPPGTYDVIVTDNNGCMAFDTVTLDPCCTLMFTCPPVDGGTFACTTDVPAPDTTVISVTDFCDPLMISSADVSNGATGCAGDPIIITRTYTISDGSGSSGTCVQTFTVQDTVAPALVDCPSDTTILCNTATDTMTLGSPVYMDACDGATITFSDVLSGFDGSCTATVIGTITRSFVGTDDCGNMNTSCQQIITVVDTVAPSFTAPADTIMNCDTDISPAFAGEISDTTDNCTAMTVTFSDATMTGACPIVEVVTRTWVVTDACGNSATDVQTISLIDSVAPTFTVPPDTVISCSADSSPVFTGEVTDTLDNCSAITVDFMDLVVPDGCPSSDTIFRTWIVSDACGNSATGLQTIIRLDTIAPTFTVPPDVTIDCTDDTSPATTGDVTDLMDNCSPDTIMFSDMIIPGPCDGTDTIVRTWTASDICGNSNTAVQLIVRVDTEAPTITSCPADVTINCDESSDPVNTGMPTATDNCSASVTITYSDDSAGGTCSTDPPIMRTWTITDDCGNSTTCVQMITIQDTVPPTLLQGTCPADVTIDCNDSSDPADLGIPMYLDNCSAVTVTVQNDSTGFDGTCAAMVIGTITRTFYAEDICGNIDSSCVQVITVQDATGPTFTVPPDVTIECGQDSLPANTGDVTDAADNCSNVTVDFSDVVSPDGCPAIDTIFRTWTATDACGNVTTGLQTILREDNMAPTFTTPADTAIDCSIDPDPANTGMVMNAVDNCTDVTVTYSDAVSGGTCPVVSTIMRTWIVSDECGNSTTDVQTITLIDTIAPTFTTPADVTISCEDDPGNLQLTGDVTDAADNCSASVTTTFTDSPTLGCNGTGTILRTWSATDDCGNVSTGVQTITIEDVVPPTALCMDITIDFNLGDVQTITPADVDAGSFDNCGDVTLALSQTEFNCLAFVNDSIQTVILTVTDECGLVSTCEVQVTGIGGAGLVLNCPAAVVVDLDPGACSGIANYEVSVSPLCGSLDNVTILQVDNSGLTSGDYFPIGTTIQEYIAFTPFGDTASCSFPVIVVEHPQDPWVACNDTVTISANGDCEVVINPDIILEGGVYGCFDDFIITVEGFGTAGGEIILTDPELGVYYNVTITTEDGLSCWGKIVIEDKLPPMITCTDVTLECGDDT